MKRIAGFTLVVLGAIAAIVFFAVASKTPQAPTVSGKLIRIRVGGHTTILGAPLVIARDEGYYREEALDVEIVPVESSKESMAAMVGGDFFVVIGSISAGSFNLASKSDLKVVADAARVLPGLLIRKDLYDSGALTELAQLKGRAVATPREGSASYYALSRMLSSAGLAIGDLDPKYLQEKEAVAALEGRNIDAAILNEPFATAATMRGLGVKYPAARLASIFPPDGQEHMLLFTTAGKIATEPDTLRRFLRAYLKGVKLYEEARQRRQPAQERVTKIIAGYTGSDETTVEESSWPYVPLDGRPDVAYLATALTYFKEQRLVTEPVDLGKTMDLRFLP